MAENRTTVVEGIGFGPDARPAPEGRGGNASGIGASVVVAITLACSAVGLGATLLIGGVGAVASAAQPAGGTSVARATTPATRPATVASRVYGKWVHTKIEGGGWVQNVVEAASDPNRAYAYVDMGGVYRSDDAGWSWRNITTDLDPKGNGYDIRGLSVDPRNADVVLICVGSHIEAKWGVMRSTDGGTTWTLVQPAPFAGNSSRNRSAGMVIARSPSDPDHVVTASHGDGLFASKDGGATWTSLGLKDHEFLEVAFDRTDPRRIWASAIPYKGRLSGREGEVTLAGGVFRTDDGGATWAKVHDGPITEMLQSHDDPSRLLGIYGFKEVRISRDRGTTWAPFSEGIPTKPDDAPALNSPFRFGALASGPGFDLVANHRGQVFRLDPGSVVWKQVTPRWIDSNGWWGQRPGQYQRFGVCASNLTVSKWDPNRWYMVDWYAIWRTDDAGRTWTPAIDGYEPTVVFGLIEAPGRDGVVHFVMADNGHFVSKDGGESFKQSGRGLTSQMRGLAACRADGSRMYAAGRGRQSPGNWVSDHVYRSDDGGETWNSAIGTGLPDLIGKKLWAGSIAAHFENKDVAMVAVSGRVAPGEGGPYLTRDGGATWTWAGAGLPAQDRFFHDNYWQRIHEVVAAPGGRWYAVSAHSPAVWAMDEASGTWTKLTDLPAAPFSLDADPRSTGVAVSVPEHGVWVSEDAGGTWSQTLKSDTLTLAWEDGFAGRIAVGTRDGKNGVMLSRDRGKTWELTDPSLPMRHGPRPAFAHGRLFVMSSGGGLFHLLDGPPTPAK